MKWPRRFFLLAGQLFAVGQVLITHAGVERDGAEEEGGHDGKWSGEVV
jgi:hypothetical protein